MRVQRCFLGCSPEPSEKAAMQSSVASGIEVIGRYNIGAHCAVMYNPKFTAHVSICEFLISAFLSFARLKSRLPAVVHSDGRCGTESIVCSGHYHCARVLQREQEDGRCVRRQPSPLPPFFA